MAGHSKWAKVKYQKAIKDPKRSKAFSKLSALITVAARDSGDIESNPKLRMAVDKAKEIGMPKENIEKAIKRGSGEIKEGEKLEEIMCEAYAPGGSALLIQAITNNKNRTIAEIKHILQKNQAKMADTGSVLWSFKEMGKIILPKKFWNDEISLAAIEKGAEEIKEEDNQVIIYTAFQNFSQMKNFLLEHIDDEFLKTEIDFISQQPIDITDPEIKNKLEQLFNELDEHNDVEEIYSNIQ
ncbi:MAG: YebC/PmpR family DNA-binding transcriptional regulator [Candidatus Pacebacteria bacterium]|nr:YebC/PmpR family DNA-binding transcriptional regulator [Candidatus Paceibacterota bacterium]MDD5721997.1 YebC/PmpR family DNA-binding transcriptional regulator [Candidatus Paceibacterota bacterium]